MACALALRGQSGGGAAVPCSLFPTAGVPTHPGAQPTAEERRRWGGSTVWPGSVAVDGAGRGRGSSDLGAALQAEGGARRVGRGLMDVDL